MGVVHGNIDTLDSKLAVGFIPEINDEGVFTLSLVRCNSTETEVIPFHVHQLVALTEHTKLLEGHARELLIDLVKNGSEFDANYLVQKVQAISDRLTEDSTTDLERTLLSYGEGDIFVIKAKFKGRFVTLVPRCLRYEAYSIWEELLADIDISHAVFYDGGRSVVATYDAKPKKKDITHELMELKKKYEPYFQDDFYSDDIFDV